MKWIIQFVLKQFAKRSAKKTGIVSLKKASDSIVKSNVRNIEIILKDMGVDINKLKSTDDVLKHMNYRQAIMDQSLKAKTGAFTRQLMKDMDVPKKDPFQGFKPRVQQDVDSIVKNLKSMEPVAAMKEANLVIGRKGNYRHLSNDEAQRILKETDDHIFQRDIKYDEFGDPIKPDPEDMASGGIAGQLHLNRPGYAGGAIVKGGAWFLKQLKKALDDLIFDRSNTFAKLPEAQKIKLYKETEAMIKHIEGGGKIPDEIIQTMKKDPNFKLVDKTTRSKDKDLAEIEDLVFGETKDFEKIDLMEFKKTLPAELRSNLERLPTENQIPLLKKFKEAFEATKTGGVEGGVDVLQKELLEGFKPKGKPHAAGGRVSYTKGGLAHVLGV